MCIYTSILINPTGLSSLILILSTGRPRRGRHPHGYFIFLNFRQTLARENDLLHRAIKHILHVCYHFHIPFTRLSVIINNNSK